MSNVYTSSPNSSLVIVIIVDNSPEHTINSYPNNVDGRSRVADVKLKGITKSKWSCRILETGTYINTPRLTIHIGTMAGG